MALKIRLLNLMLGKAVKVKYKKMKDTYGKRLYKCKCGAINEDFVWQNDINKHKFKCVKCNKTLGFEDLLKVEKVQLPSIRTDTKNR